MALVTTAPAKAVCDPFRGSKGENGGGGRSRQAAPARNRSLASLPRYLAGPGTPSAAQQLTQETQREPGRRRPSSAPVKSHSFSAPDWPRPRHATWRPKKNKTGPPPLVFRPLLPASPSPHHPLKEKMLPTHTLTTPPSPAPAAEATPGCC